MLYLLDASEPAAPTLTLQGEIPGLPRFREEWTREVTAELLLSDGDFAIAHEDPIYGSDGNSVLNAQGDGLVRFYLHRVQVDADGLAVQPPVNTPGLPLAWDGDRVFSLEPGYADDGEPAVTLHRAELRDGFAYIDESVLLGGGFIDGRVVDNHLWALMGVGDACSAAAATTLLSVDLAGSPLAAGAGLELPLHAWAFPLSEPALRNGELIVRGGPLPGARLRVDISDPASPRVARYQSIY